MSSEWAHAKKREPARIAGPNREGRDAPGSAPGGPLAARKEGSSVFLIRTREGSIPLVLIVVILLGIGAAASLFSTLGDARLNRRSERNALAKMLAQSAVEETLVKITNNSARFPDLDTNAIRWTYPTRATQFWANEQQFELAETELLGRLVEKPEDPGQLALFNDLITHGPHFAHKDIVKQAVEQGGGPAPDNSLDWRDPNNRPPFLQDTGPFADTFSGMLTAMQPAAQSYRDTHWTNYQSSVPEDRHGLRPAFWAIDRLPALDAAGNVTTAQDYNELDKSNVFTSCHFADCTVAGDPDAAGPSADMRRFMDQWDNAMEKVADQVDDRIAGCAGDATYGVGAMFAALALGAPAQDNQAEEEEFRNSALQGGVLDYKSFLVSVVGRAYSSPGAAMHADKSVTAHRLISRMSLVKASEMMLGNMVPYVMQMYRLTPQDLVVLGWIAPMTYRTSGTTTPAGPGDEIVEPNPRDQMLTKLTERYPPTGMPPRIVPFQAASCVGRVQ